MSADPKDGGLPPGGAPQQACGSGPCAACVDARQMSSPCARVGTRRPPSVRVRRRLRRAGEQVPRAVPALRRLVHQGQGARRRSLVWSARLLSRCLLFPPHGQDNSYEDKDGPYRPLIRQPEERSSHAGTVALGS